MAEFGNANANFTPSTSQDNWVLDPSTNITNSKVKWVAWGGQGTSSTGYRTRWYRPTTIGSGAFTAVGAVNKGNNPGATPLLQFGTFATQATPPADPGALFDQAWNVLGGGGILVLPIGSEWAAISVGTSTINGQIACRNAAGVDPSISSYSCQWAD
jgi:hypothetical protein